MITFGLHRRLAPSLLHCHLTLSPFRCFYSCPFSKQTEFILVLLVNKQHFRHSGVRQPEMFTMEMLPLVCTENMREWEVEQTDAWLHSTRGEIRERINFSLPHLFLTLNFHILLYSFSSPLTSLISLLNIHWGFTLASVSLSTRIHCFFYPWLLSLLPYLSFLFLKLSCHSGQRGRGMSGKKNRMRYSCWFIYRMRRGVR